MVTHTFQFSAHDTQTPRSRESIFDTGLDRLAIQRENSNNNMTTTYPTPQKTLFSVFFPHTQGLLMSPYTMYVFVCVCVWFIDSVHVILPCPVLYTSSSQILQTFFPPLSPLLNPYINIAVNTWQIPRIEYI